MSHHIEDTLSVVGLGKLGACMAAAIADRGFNVIGVDENERVVRAVNEGLPPMQEPGLGGLIASNRARLRATDSFADAVSNSSATFVVVPTPSDERGAFSLRFAARAFRRM